MLLSPYPHTTHTFTYMNNLHVKGVPLVFQIHRGYLYIRHLQIRSTLPVVLGSAADNDC